MEVFFNNYQQFFNNVKNLNLYKKDENICIDKKKNKKKIYKKKIYIL